MKVITFRKELIALIQSGDKTQTRRKISYSRKTQHPIFRRPIMRYRKGDICVIKNSRFRKETYGYVYITDVRKETIRHMTTLSARAEGFGSIEDFQFTWDKLHPKWDWMTPVWVIEFVYLSALPVMLNKDDELLARLPADHQFAPQVKLFRD